MGLGESELGLKGCMREGFQYPAGAEKPGAGEMWFRLGMAGDDKGVDVWRKLPGFDGGCLGTR